MAQVLTLMSSPRKNGNTDRLANAFIKGVEENGYSTEKIYVNYQNIYGYINTGKRKILKIIESPISQQKYDWLVNYHNTMLEQVNNGNYNTKNKSKNTFSGYVFGDEQISNNFLKDYEYTINYHSSIKNNITILT